jgi:dipeptidyl aminopeptidase/acylaminoacyl peptidase
MSHRLPSFAPLSAILLSTLLSSLLWSACATPEPVVAPAEVVETAPEGPALHVIAMSDGGLVYHDLRTGEETPLPDGNRLVQAVPAPQGNALALWTLGADSARVHVLDRRTGASRQVWDGPVHEQISMAWSADGRRLVVGHHTGSATSMGPGGIVRVDITSSGGPMTLGGVTDVGCSASKVVLAVRPDGALLVRGSDNLYVVEADGCATLQAIDARRMHQITPSPDGRHLAYIFRELVYNRQARAYEPDSTLYVSSLDDTEPVKVIGDRYAPRNPVWSPDGAQLGYDVRPPDGNGQRTVSSWTMSDGQSGYIVPPGAAAGSVTNLRFAPGSAVVAFQVDGDWHFRGGPGTFMQPFPGDESPRDFMWLDGSRVLAWYGTPSGNPSERAAILTLASDTPPEPYPGVVWAAPDPR